MTGLARANWALPRQSPPEPRGGDPQARRPIAGSRAGSDDEPDAVQPSDGNAWTTVRVRELRQRLGIAPFDPTIPRAQTISADAAAIRLSICVGSVHKLIREGVLPATQ